MSIIVEAQDQTIANVEQEATQINVNMEQGVQHVDQALTSARSARKVTIQKKFFFFYKILLLKIFLIFLFNLKYFFFFLNYYIFFFFFFIFFIKIFFFFL